MSAADASILVVDDDANVLALITSVLQSRGYRVREASSGEDALSSARGARPSLVLLDVQLPGMSGYEVCRQLRAEFGERLPIVFVSGARTEPYDRAGGLRLGADDYIVKPFSADELLARVDRLIDVAAGASTGRSDPPASRLSPRELEVLRLVADGRLSKEIAHELSLSTRTVSNHIQNIFMKLDVHTRAQAVAAVLRDGWPAGSNGKREPPP